MATLKKNAYYKYKKPVINGSIYGALIYDNNAIITGRTGAYAITPEIPPLSSANSWEFKTKYTYNGGGSYPSIIGSADSNLYHAPRLHFQSGFLKVSLSTNGTSWLLNAGTSTCPATVGATYYLKMGFNGTQYYLWWSTVSFTDANGKKDILLESTSKQFCSTPLALLNNVNNTGSYYSAGTMDLSQTSLTINGKVWWDGLKKSLSNKPFYNLNIQKIGEIKCDEEGVISGFDTKINHASFKVKVPTKSFELVIKFKQIQSLASTSILQSNVQYQGIILRNVNASTGQLNCWIGAGSWSINNSDTGIRILPNVDTYIKIYWNGSAYIFSQSENGTTWTTRNTITNAVIVGWSGLIQCLGGCNWESYPFTAGEIDLKGCYLNIDGTRYWNGTTLITPSSSNYDLISAESKFYPLMRKKNVYCKYKDAIINGSIIGYPVFDCNSRLTGRNASYILTDGIPPISTANSWEFKTKYTYNGGGSYPSILGSGESTIYHAPRAYFQSGYLKVSLSTNGTSWAIDGFTTKCPATVGATYYIKLGFTGSEYYLWWSTTSFTDANGTREVVLSSTAKHYCSTPFAILNNVNSTGAYYSLGTVDLSQTSITINGQIWWNGLKKIYSDKPFYKLNILKVGELKNDEETNISGFDAKTVHGMFKVKVPTKSFELVIKFKQLNIIANTSILESYASTQGIVLRNVNARTGQLNCWIGAGSWTISNTDTGIRIDANVETYVKIYWDGTSYIFYQSTDGKNWITRKTITKTVVVGWSSGYQCLGGATWESYPFTSGSIDLKGCYLNIDGSRYWTGATLVTPSSSNSDLTTMKSDCYVLTRRNNIKYFKRQKKEYIIPTLTENGTMGGSNFACYADSSNGGVKNTYQAFNPNTGVVSNYGDEYYSELYIHFYVPVPVLITWFSFYVPIRNDSNKGGACTNICLYGSDCDGNWTALFSNPGAGSGWGNKTHEFDMSSNTKEYQYYKLRVGTGGHSYHDQIDIQKLQFKMIQNVSESASATNYDYFTYNDRKFI